MKITKSILQAVVAGLALGATATACEVSEQVNTDELIQTVGDQMKENEDRENGNPPVYSDCPACGMG